MFPAYPTLKDLPLKLALRYIALAHFSGLSSPVTRSVCDATGVTIEELKVLTTWWNALADVDGFPPTVFSDRERAARGLPPIPQGFQTSKDALLAYGMGRNLSVAGELRELDRWSEEAGFSIPELKAFGEFFMTSPFLRMHKAPVPVPARVLFQDKSDPAAATIVTEETMYLEVTDYYGYKTTREWHRYALGRNARGEVIWVDDKETQKLFNLLPLEKYHSEWELDLLGEGARLRAIQQRLEQSPRSPLTREGASVAAALETANRKTNPTSTATATTMASAGTAGAAGLGERQ